MTPYILDLIDSNISFFNPDQHSCEPGMALWDGSRYVFGDQIWLNYKLKPQQIAHRYWLQPSLESLASWQGDARHSADLIHAQLAALAGEDEVSSVIAVPGHYSDDQLSLMLGILNATPIQALCLLHRSVALGHLYAQSNRTLHIELQLHQLLVTELHVVDKEILVKRSTAVSGQGLLALQDRLLQLINTQFIEQTRFDALRSGFDEQALSDQIAATPLGETQALHFQCQGHKITLSTDQLTPAYQPLLDALERLSPSSAHCLIEDWGRGLAPACPDSWTVTPIPKNDLVDHYDALLSLTQGADAYTLIDSLPFSLGLAAQADNSNAERITQAFGLIDYRAVPLKQWLTRHAPSASLNQWRLTVSSATPELITINGKLVSKEQKIRPGDRINVNGAVMTLIEVDE